MNKEKSIFLWLARANGKETMKNFLASLQLQKYNPTLLLAQFRALSSRSRMTRTGGEDGSFCSRFSSERKKLRRLA
ncbi:hypothetical protein AB9F39_37500, partial [Rhizobium leguminosarum]|uniref:hypothetical protein n=1 Tax=Rhizobium leguminosarum TaxID=384 RepID=UPI003F96EB1C